MINPKTGHNFKAWICIAIAILVIVLSVLALALPYWVYWTPNYRYTVANSIFSGTTTNNQVTRTVNAGLWTLFSKDTYDGTCLTSDCICSRLNSLSSSTAQNLYYIANSNEPTCSDFKTSSCSGTTAGQAFRAELKTTCSPAIWAQFALCSTTTQVAPASCPAGAWDDCMNRFLNVSIAFWFIAIGFCLFAIIVWLMMHSRPATSLPTFALIALFFVFIAWASTLIAIIVGAFAFKGGVCDNNWDRMGSGVQFHASFGLGIAATVIAFLLLIAAFLAWRQAVTARNNWLYNYNYYGYGYAYKPTTYYDPGYTYTAPVTYYDRTYDYTYAYPYMGYGDVGYGDAPVEQEMKGLEGSLPQSGEQVVE